MCGAQMDCDISKIPGYSSKKKYAHFDYRVTFQDVADKVMNPDFVAHHGFYPLISNTLCHTRYRDSKPVLKTREIAYASHIDHRIFQYYAMKWGNAYSATALESGINDVAVAYRAGMNLSNISAANRAFATIRGFEKAVVVTGDFSHFFDNLEHRQLMYAVRHFFDSGKMPRDHYQVLKNILHYSCWPISDLAQRNGFEWIDVDESDRATYGEMAANVRRKATLGLNRLNRVLPPSDFVAFKDSQIVLPWKKANGEVGIPQGLATSGVLANMYMFDADVGVNQIVASVGGLYQRYCDDFIIVVPKDCLDSAVEALHILEETPCVELQPDKTKVYLASHGDVHQLRLDSFSRGNLEMVDSEDRPRRQVSYLGFDYDGSSVKIRQSTVGRFYGRFYRAAHAIENSSQLPGRHPSKKRVSALYEHYSPKGMHARSEGRGSKRYGNYLSYVERVQRSFPDDPIDGHVSQMYKKIKRTTGRG